MKDVEKRPLLEWLGQELDYGKEWLLLGIVSHPCVGSESRSQGNRQNKETIYPSSSITSQAGPFSPLFFKEVSGDISGRGRLFMPPKPYRQGLKKHSRILRQKMTDAELKLWFRIRRKQIAGVQFYRQKPLLDFIVDFYAPSARLVIEVDGSQHAEPMHYRRDMVRDKRLEELGLTVLRFDNAQVLLEIEAVLERIYDVIERTPATPEDRKSPLSPL